MITSWADIKAKSKIHDRTCQILVKVCTFIIVWLWQSWRQQWNCLCLTHFFFKSLWACQFSRLLKANASEAEIEFLKIGQESESFILMQKKSPFSAFFFILYCSQFSQAWTRQCLLLVLLISNWGFYFVPAAPQLELRLLNWKWPKEVLADTTYDLYF